jgi:hypothetical protein
MSDPTQPHWLIRYRWVIAAAFALFAIYFFAVGDWLRGTIALVCFAAFPVIVNSQWQRRRIDQARRQSRAGKRDPRGKG